MASIIGDDDSNFLIGNPESDFIDGLGGNDVLLGGAGNDTLVGGAGDDFLSGGLGFDVVAYGLSTAVFVDLAQNSAAGGEAFGDSFASIEGVLGSNEQDFIIGDAASNFLEGNGGNDLMRGGGDRDFLRGDAGNDILEGGDGDDVFSGGTGADRIDGEAGIDFVFYTESSAAVAIDLTAGTASGGDAEGDRLTSIEAVDGTGLDDTLTGDALANFFDGNGGFDRINGAGGNDRLEGDGILLGGGGNDTIFGGVDLAASMNGGGGRDFLFGDELADTISGGKGSDTISGDLGADIMRGDANADIFQYIDAVESKTGPGASDLIQDFSRAQGDKIDLAFTFDNPNTLPDEPLRFIGKASFTGAGGELRFGEVKARDLTFIQADVDGDSVADLQVKFTGLIGFTATDFIL